MAKLVGEMTIVCGPSVVVTPLADAAERLSSIHWQQVNETGVWRQMTLNKSKGLVVNMVQTVV